MQTPGILVLNSGSSSLKAAVYEHSDDLPCLWTARVERIGSQEAFCTLTDEAGDKHRRSFEKDEGRTHETVIGWLLQQLDEASSLEVVAAGHRIVHGGVHFSGATLINDAVLDRLTALIPMARSHQPFGLAGVNGVRAMSPDLPQVASFDTAFHSTLPHVVSEMPLPRSITDKGVRRYGFHGLSYQWIASQLPNVRMEGVSGRVIVAHLGNGSSLCGMKDGKSTSTTMGFTPLDGLMMGERPGAIDAGVVLYLLEEMQLPISDVQRLLYKESGLLGVSGLSNDMRVLEASDEPHAKEAIDLYVHQAARQIAVVASDLAGLDALVFTAGIGENSAYIRSRIVELCEWMGVFADAEKNTQGAACISPVGSPIQVYVIPTNEEAVIAGNTRTVLAEQG